MICWWDISLGYKFFLRIVYLILFYFRFIVLNGKIKVGNGVVGCFNYYLF